MHPYALFQLFISLLHSVNQCWAFGRCNALSNKMLLCDCLQIGFWEPLGKHLVNKGSVPLIIVYFYRYTID